MATEVSTTTGKQTAPGQASQHGGEDPDQIMLAIIIACVGGVVIIITIILAVVWIRKSERKAAKKREKAFKIKYAPSIHDLDRRSANIMDARVTIQQAEDNDYCDPESAVDNKAGTSDDTVVNRKRAQVTNKARMRAIQDTYDVPKPRMSQIPAAPEPVGVDQRAPAAVPADVAAKTDALNQGQDANRVTDQINTSGDDTEEEYSYAYAGFVAPPEPKVKDTGKTSYERLVN